MATLNSHAEKLAELWPGTILWNCPLAPYSTMKVGGPAEAVLHAGQLSDLVRLIAWLRENRIPWYVIGRGSNILVPDEGLPGVVIFLNREFSAIEIVAAGTDQGDGDKKLVRAGAGCSLARLVHFATSNELAGLEFAVGIPGSVGGAIIMNAGAWGRDMAGLIRSVSVLTTDGAVATKERHELHFKYRDWGESRKTVVLAATFQLQKGNRDEITELCEKYAGQRRQSQPVGTASAGSFFKNPLGHAAGKLIEDAGFKGCRVGGAMVSVQHANFIMNTGTATAADIIGLMHLVQDGVYRRFGVRLEPEVHILAHDAVTGKEKK